MEQQVYFWEPDRYFNANLQQRMAFSPCIHKPKGTVKDYGYWQTGKCQPSQLRTSSSRGFAARSQRGVGWQNRAVLAQQVIATVGPISGITAPCLPSTELLLFPFPSPQGTPSPSADGTVLLLACLKHLSLKPNRPISESSPSKTAAGESRKGEDIENRLEKHCLVQAGFQQKPYVFP